MIVEFDKSFFKSLDQLKSSTIATRIETTISIFENAESLQVISNIKKLSGYKNYYRLRSGDYRLGLELINQKTIRFIVIAHRKDIYNIFP